MIVNQVVAVNHACTATLDATAGFFLPLPGGRATEETGSPA
jgi:hypothetical protein